MEIASYPLRLPLGLKTALEEVAKSEEKTLRDTMIHAFHVAYGEKIFAYRRALVDQIYERCRGNNRDDWYNIVTKEVEKYHRENPEKVVMDEYEERDSIYLAVGVRGRKEAEEIEKAKE